MTQDEHREVAHNAELAASIRDDLADLARSGVADAHYDSSGFRDGYCLPLDGVARLLVERERAAAAQAWDEGWTAAKQVLDFEGQKVWAHAVLPEGYEGNPYRKTPEGDR